MIVHQSFPQGSEEWYAMRRGRPTASRFKDIMTPGGSRSVKVLKAKDYRGLTPDFGRAKKQADTWARLKAGETVTVSEVGDGVARGLEAKQLATIEVEEITIAPRLSESHIGYIDELIAECFCPDFEMFMGTAWTDRGLEMEPEARDAFETLTGLTAQEVGFVTRDDEIVGCSPDSLIGEDGRWTEGLEIKCPMPKTHVKYVREGVLPDEYKAQVHGGMAVTGLDRWHFFSYFPGMQPLHLVIERDDYTEQLSAALDDFLGIYAAARAELIPKLQVEEEKA